jgi:5-methylcytosine-specific restriction endonuclease McrBC GTP-binding regulatory subunit McrB
MFSAINNLADFTINLEKFTDDSRYYVRSDDELFKKTFRKIVVPKLTDLQFVKYDEANEIVLYLNVNYEYNRVRTDAEEVTKLTFETDICPKYKRNRILFGAPGTGKSFTLNREKAELLEADSETDYERVTFHPDYSYANFVGTYKPTMVKNESTSDFDDDKKKDIAYEYVPGPFMRVLVKALKSALSGNRSHIF